jgi:sugar lactone lactonase YvrE
VSLEPQRTLELALDVGAELGEGPIWDADRDVLLFVDIMRGDVHVFDPARPATKSHRVVPVGLPVGAVACTVRGDWIAAAGQGFHRIDPESGRLTAVAEAAPGRTDLRMNDGYVDHCGSFWAGTLSLQRTPNQGALYRLTTDGRVETILEPVTTSNGIDWSPDGRLMYYVDTGTRRIDVFDADPDVGRVSNRRPFVDLNGQAGRPDGLVVDAEGGVWVALWRGGAVRRYRSDGSLDQELTLPTDLVTKCAFGGPGMTDLYITTAWRDLTVAERAAQPHAGGVFRARPGVAGQPARRFGG